MSAIAGIYAELDRLKTRVAELEQRGGSSEALVPNSYTVDSAGNVALTGVDLPAGTTTTPPDQDRIRWLMASGAAVAQIFGYASGGSESLTLISQAAAPTDNSGAILTVLDDQGTVQAFVWAQQQSRGISAFVKARAGLATVDLLRQDGSSAFLQGAKALSELTNSATATAGAAGAPPAQVKGYIVAQDHAGAAMKIPYYAT